MSVRYLIALCICSVVAGTASLNAAPQGSVEGQLKIVSLRPVELAGENRTTETAAVPATAKNYADYPLIILTQGERKQIARITADAEEIIARRFRRASTSSMWKDACPSVCT